MRSHVVRIGHRTASIGTVANPAPAFVADREPRSIREQQADKRTDTADALIRDRRARRQAWERSRGYFAPLAPRAPHASGGLFSAGTVALIAGDARDIARGYCDVPDREYVIVR